MKKYEVPGFAKATPRQAKYKVPGFAKATPRQAKYKVPGFAKATPWQAKNKAEASPLSPRLRRGKQLAELIVEVEKRFAINNTATDCSVAVDLF